MLKHQESLSFDSQPKFASSSIEFQTCSSRFYSFRFLFLFSWINQIQVQLLVGKDFPFSSQFAHLSQTVLVQSVLHGIQIYLIKSQVVVTQTPFPYLTYSTHCMSVQHLLCTLGPVQHQHPGGAQDICGCEDKSKGWTL